jgi:hypothetical protein
MAVTLPARAALLLVPDDQDLRSAADLRDGAGHFGLGDVRSADGRVLAVVDQEDLVEGDGIALFVGAGELLDGDGVPFRDRVLLASRLYDGEFHRPILYRNQTQKAIDPKKSLSCLG